SPVRGSESPKSTTAFGSSASCSMIWDISTWSRGPCRQSTTRSARGCHPCLRYKLLPMSPGRTGEFLAEREGEVPAFQTDDFQDVNLGTSNFIEKNCNTSM